MEAAPAENPQHTAAQTLAANSIAGNAAASVQTMRELSALRCSAIEYFLLHQAPNGLFPDRVSNSHGLRGNISSCAATGYGLAALALAAEEGLIAQDAAKARVLQTLATIENNMKPEHKGWLYHFTDIRTGEPLIG